jgi:hypothetical protein
VAEPLPIERAVCRVLVNAHHLEPDRVVPFVAREAAAAGLHDVDAFLVDNQQVHLTSLTSGARQRVEGTLVGDTYRRGRAHTVDLEDGRTLVLVPLLDGEDRLGVLAAAADSARGMARDDVRTLASVTASVLVSKRAYTDKYELASRVTRMDVAAEFRWALLPPLTMTTARVRVAGMVEPAYEIAGDAFDYACNDGVLHVAMFDAVGHGLRACRLANLAIATYRNCRRNRVDLSGTAAAIDHELVEQFGESWFCTALLGELDVDRGVFRFMSAGHPLPILLRSGKVVATLEAPPGVPLGLGGPVPAVTTHALEPDDAFFVYSDGVTEARNDDGEFFGEERLADALARASTDDLSSPETVRRLVLRLYQHNPSPLRDDATMLLVNWPRTNDAGADD